jgi:hypothetical protein
MCLRFNWLRDKSPTKEAELKFCARLNWRLKIENWRLKISCHTADRDNLRISFTFFTEQKKVTKKCSTIYPRHFPSFRFATNGTTDKAHDLNRAKLLLASPLCLKETQCFFSLVALRYSADGKLGNFEQAISREVELWGIINQIVSVPRGRIVFGSGFRHFDPSTFRVPQGS